MSGSPAPSQFVRSRQMWAPTLRRRIMIDLDRHRHLRGSRCRHHHRQRRADRGRRHRRTSSSRPASASRCRWRRRSSAERQRRRRAGAERRYRRPGHRHHRHRTLTITGDLVMTGGSILPSRSGGGRRTIRRAQCKRRRRHRRIDLGGATLTGSLIGGFTPDTRAELHDHRECRQRRDRLAFNGLSEGAGVSFAGQTFTVSYLGGDGNDVTLTAVRQRRAGTDRTRAGREHRAGRSGGDATDPRPRRDPHRPREQLLTTGTARGRRPARGGHRQRAVDRLRSGRSSSSTSRARSTISTSRACWSARSRAASVLRSPSRSTAAPTRRGRRADPEPHLPRQRGRSGLYPQPLRDMSPTPMAPRPDRSR